MSIPTTVAICVATYLRPKRLGELLDSLRLLDVQGLNVHLIIADNDASGSAQAVVQERTADFPYPVTYVIESARGLASVRNRLVRESFAMNAEFIAFIDDDQTADPSWLISLVSTAQTHGASVVTPIVRAEFPAGTPNAIRNCFAVSIQQEPTGSAIRNVSTNGALFRTAALREIPGPFDPRTNLTGGEDTLLGDVLTSKGHRLVLCNSALVTEHWPDSRLNPRMVLRRSWRGGILGSHRIRWVQPSAFRTAKWILLYIGFTVKNIAILPLEATRDRDLVLNRIRLIVFGASVIWHLIFGFGKQEEYSGQIHGE